MYTMNIRPSAKRDVWIFRIYLFEILTTEILSPSFSGYVQKFKWEICIWKVIWHLKRSITLNLLTFKSLDGKGGWCSCSAQGVRAPHPAISTTFFLTTLIVPKGIVETYCDSWTLSLSWKMSIMWCRKLQFFYKI